jgi:hypothetical protein
MAMQGLNQVTVTAPVDAPEPKAAHDVEKAEEMADEVRHTRS